MTRLLEHLQDLAFRLWYSLGGFALLTLPMLITAIWYHRNIGSSSGGRALMARQRASNVRPRGSMLSAQRQASEGISIMRDIAAGRYGQHARRLQNRVYWVTGLWLSANIVYFGLWLWSDELARVTPQ